MIEQSQNKDSKNEKIVVVSVKSQKSSGEKIFRLHKKRAVLGSAMSSDVCLEDASISPVHAILEVNGIDGKPVLYDLASDTGILVNGQKTVQATLNTDDKVQIGPYLITVRIQALSDVPEPPQYVKDSMGQKLFVNEKEDLAPLLLEDESEVLDIFDHRPADSKQSLQVVMFYGETILDVEHFVDRKRIVIGPGNKEDFSIPPFFGAEKGRSARFDLVTNEGGQYYLHLHESMEGVINQKGSMQPLRDLMRSGPKTVPLVDQDFAKVKLNDVSFFLNFTAAPPKLRRRRLFERDPLFAKIWIASLAFTGATLLGVTQATVNPTIEVEQLPERIATIIYEPKLLPVVKPPEPKKPEPVVEKKEEPKPEPKKEPKVIKVNPSTKPPEKPAPKDAEISDAKKTQPLPQVKHAQPKQLPKVTKKEQAKMASGQEGAGARAKGEEGSRGAPDKKPAKDHQTKAQRPGPGPKTNNAAQNAGSSQTNDLGLVDMFKSNKGTLNKVLAGGKGVSNAANKLEGYSGFTSQGEGGLGAAGSGKGGGGKSEGLGGLADHGAGGGRKGTGLGALGNGGNMLGGTGKLAISGGGSPEPIVLGAIDTDAIARAIAAHRDEIRACYESEISAGKSDLAGRIGVRFVIGASGIVNSAGVSSTSMHNANVENCVVEVIKRIEFPKVKGGGIAEVTYPFVFKPSNK